MRLPTEQFRDTIIVILREKKHPQTLLQRSLHGQELSAKRGELDGNEALADFAGKLEKATLDTIESGKMTKDLALITSLKEVQVLNSKEFILAVKTKLDELMA